MKFKKDQKITAPAVLSTHANSFVSLELELDRGNLDDQRYQKQQQLPQQPLHDTRQPNAFYSTDTSTQRLFDDFR